MNNIHMEKEFESNIVDYLSAHGWLEGSCEGYDVDAALYTQDALAWARAAHADAWEKLEAQHGDKAADVFLSRLSSELESQGTLAVLRHGFKIIGARGEYFSMLQSKPSSALNPETTALYGRNVLRVVRQVFYSRSNKNSIDLVLFVNGLPVATVELKTESTQSVYAAIKQYRKDRLHKDAVTHKPELLLQFKSRCVVHLESKLDAAGIYLESEVGAFASFYWDPKRKKDSHFQLQKYLGPSCDRFKQRYVTALNEDNGEAKDTLETFAKAAIRKR